MLMGFISWWYGEGWKQVADSFKPRLAGVMTSFSVRQLLPTMFSPWRRIISSPGKALDDKLRAMVDNFFSRIIGFVVRLGVLIGAVVALLAVAIFTFAELLLWPILPIAGPVLIVAGLLG